jgi:hypothetical protein
MFFSVVRTDVHSVRIPFIPITSCLPSYVRVVKGSVIRKLLSYCRVYVAIVSVCMGTIFTYEWVPL